MTAIERCDVCGFAWDTVDPLGVATRVRVAADALATLLEQHPESSVRPAADERWSALEYGCHVRDVLVNLRDRIILGAVEDNPVPKAMFGAARVEMGLYTADTPAVTATDLRVAGELFARTWDLLPDDRRDRPIHYGWPRPETRTLSWVAAQAVHEVEHHLDDARARTSE